MQSSLLFLLLSLSFTPFVVGLLPVVLEQKGHSLLLSNSFALLEFDLHDGRLKTLKGDVSGSGSWGSNLVPGYGGDGGFAVVVQPAKVFENSPFGNIPIKAFSTVYPRTTPLPYQIENRTDDKVTLFFPSIDLGEGLPINLSVSLRLSLSRSSRSFDFSVRVNTLAGGSASAIRVTMNFTPISSTLFFNDGPIQMMRQPTPYYQSRTDWERFYCMGGGGSVDVVPVDVSDSSKVVLAAGIVAENRCGLQMVLFGSNILEEMWVDGFEGCASQCGLEMTSAQEWTLQYTLGPSDANFPASALPTDEKTMAHMDMEDVHASLAAAYGSQAGQDMSHTYAPTGKFSPCLSSPKPCYEGLYNFFDPDNFNSVLSMMYAGDDYLWSEVKKLIDTNMEWLCKEDTPGVCFKGQAAHHFVPQDQCFEGTPFCLCRVVNYTYIGYAQDCVTYTAISGATQTGPNLFWVWSCLNYVKYSGDYAWLEANAPSLRLALSFLVDMIDQREGLLLASGSLMIDTFIRKNYTTDSNAGMVLILTEFAAAEKSLGNLTGAQDLLQLAEMIRTSMAAKLWDSASDDHFVTQRNPDGTTRDFVDYDANLLAVFAGVPSLDQARRLLDRVDSGPCTHSRAGTWVSEIYYDADNCESFNTGDSAITMGRVAWADAHARFNVRSEGDRAVANQIISDLKEDMIENTFLYERYQCGGHPTHNPNYHEYPAITSMLIWEIRYGISISYENVMVDPWLAPETWSWSVGRFSFFYSRGSSPTFEASLNQLQSGSKTFSVGGLPTGKYTVTDSCGGASQAMVGSSGVLRFSAMTGSGCSVKASKS